MSAPPLPDDSNDLYNEQGDYLEVLYEDLETDIVYIFYNEWTDEMMRVEIFLKDDDIIKYHIVDNDGDYVPIQRTVTIEEWDENGFRAFRYIPPEIAPRLEGGTKRKRKNKKSKKNNKSTKYKKYNKSKKSKKKRNQKRYNL